MADCARCKRKGGYCSRNCAVLAVKAGQKQKKEQMREQEFERKLYYPA
jgi:hypothetical protein